MLWNKCYKVCIKKFTHFKKKSFSTFRLLSKWRYFVLKNANLTWKFPNGTTMVTISLFWPSICAWLWWKWQISQEEKVIQNLMHYNDQFQFELYIQLTLKVWFKSGNLKKKSKFIIFINEKFKKIFYSFRCIFSDYMGHDINKEFWKNDIWFFFEVSTLT